MTTFTRRFAFILLYAIRQIFFYLVLSAGGELGNAFLECCFRNCFFMFLPANACLEQARYAALDQVTAPQREAETAMAGRSRSVIKFINSFSPTQQYATAIALHLFKNIIVEAHTHQTTCKDDTDSYLTATGQAGG